MNDITICNKCGTRILHQSDFPECYKCNFSQDWDEEELGPITKHPYSLSSTFIPVKYKNTCSFNLLNSRRADEEPRGHLYFEGLVQKLSIDSVFGIFTRAAFQEIVFPKVKHLIKGIVFGDIDNMHQLNEDLGYREVDAKIKTAINARKEDIIARWYSGDEIVWVVLEGDIHGLERRIRHDFAIQGIFITTYSTNCTSNYGKELSWQEFLDAIETATLMVKAKKKNGL